MHVTKIKIKQDRVFVEYDKIVIVEDKELLNKYSIDSPEQPVTEFKKSFQSLDFFLIELCELCDKPGEIPIMCEDVTITGLTLKYADGELTSAIVTGTKQLAYSNSPLVLNTPNKSINIDGDFNKMVHLTDPCIATLKSVIDHAKDYVKGERLQIEMDLKEDEIVQVAPKDEKIDLTEGKGDEGPQDDVVNSNVDQTDIGEQIKENEDVLQDPPE